MPLPKRRRCGLAIFWPTAAVAGCRHVLGAAPAAWGRGRIAPAVQARLVGPVLALALVGALLPGQAARAAEAAAPAAAPLTTPKTPASAASAAAGYRPIDEIDCLEYLGRSQP